MVHESAAAESPSDSGRVCGAEAARRLRIHPGAGGLAVPGDNDATAPPASERTRRKKLSFSLLLLSLARADARFAYLVPLVHLPSLTLGAYSTAFTPGSFHGDPSLTGDRVRTAAPGY